MSEPHAGSGGQPREGAHGAHERTDVPVRPLMWGILALALLCAAALAVAAWTFDLLDSGARSRDVAGHPLAEPHQVPPAPRLQANPRADMAEMLARERALLEGYGWIDRRMGVVRIPIERAMELVVEEGLPARPAGENEPRGGGEERR